jgi:hypothetical protein
MVNEQFVIHSPTINCSHRNKRTRSNQKISFNNRLLSPQPTRLKPKNPTWTKPESKPSSTCRSALQRLTERGSQLLLSNQFELFHHIRCRFILIRQMT